MNHRSTQKGLHAILSLLPSNPFTNALQSTTCQRRELRGAWLRLCCAVWACLNIYISQKQSESSSYSTIVKTLRRPQFRKHLEKKTYAEIVEGYFFSSGYKKRKTQVNPEVNIWTRSNSTNNQDNWHVFLGGCCSFSSKTVKEIFSHAAAIWYLVMFKPIISK